MQAVCAAVALENGPKKSVYCATRTRRGTAVGCAEDAASCLVIPMRERLITGVEMYVLN